MKLPQTILLAAVTTASVIVCGHTQAQAQQFVYSGINSTTLQFPDLYGNPQPPQLFQTNAIVVIKNPLVVVDLLTGTQTIENNPFNLMLGVPAAELSSPGALTITSAAETSALSGGTFLQQFWQLQIVDSLTFQGVFTDSQFGNLANQPNLINAPYPFPGGISIGAFPYPLAQGTQLVGQFSPDFSQLRIQVSGNTTDLARPFFADITAVLATQAQVASANQASFGVAAAPSNATQVQAVPEPSAITGTVVGGLLGIGLLRKTRRKPLVLDE